VADVTTYPFSLTWSETSRYYYASLFFSERIYGLKAPLSVLHSSRYLLQAIPFLIPHSPLWFHRLWQALLWLGVTALAAWSLVRRFRIKDNWARLLLIGWVCLYFFMGSVYYHLMVSAIIILLWFNPQPKTRGKSVLSYAILIVTSIWAGISRVNWYPVPALLAILLYLLESPYHKPFWKFAGQLLLWFVIGVGVAQLTHLQYISLSGNSPDLFSSSFTSDLLWYRLFPNYTYPPGILFASLAVSFPILFFSFRKSFELKYHVHFWRWVGIISILLVLYVGGLFVSIKIGGGSNLHNLDAYWVALAVIGEYFITNSIVIDKPGQTVEETELLNQFTRTIPAKYIFAFAVLMVSIYPVFGIHAPFAQDSTLTWKSLRRLQKFVDNIPPHSEVLFITERQLLTFGYLKNIKLIPEYERVFLMEMAMANHRSYLDNFYHDLRAHRFVFIITDPLNLAIQGTCSRFGIENDAWEKKVTEQLLCFYKPYQAARMLLKDVKIQVLEPRSKPAAGCQ
jgi:hypothetical protein